MKDELALAHGEMERAGLREQGGGGANNTSPTLMRGHHGMDLAAKAKLSKDGQGMRGRPPPGAAGRDLREAHEKVKEGNDDDDDDDEQM